MYTQMGPFLPLIILVPLLINVDTPSSRRQTGPSISSAGVVPAEGTLIKVLRKPLGLTAQGHQIRCGAMEDQKRNPALPLLNWGISSYQFLRSCCILCKMGTILCASLEYIDCSIDLGKFLEEVDVALSFLLLSFVQSLQLCWRKSGWAPDAHLN